jgi:hypothetical protein
MQPPVLISLAMAFAALIVSLLCLVYTKERLRRAGRALLFKQLYEKTFEDEEMHYVHLLSENGENVFTQSHGVADLEERERRQRAIERLFGHLELVCALYRNRQLEPEDMWHFQYNIRRLSRYPGFDWYRDYLEEEWPRQRQLERGPYSSLFWYIDHELRKDPRPPAGLR